MKDTKRLIQSLGEMIFLLIIVLSDLISGDVTEPFNAFKIYEETIAKTTMPTYTHPPWIEPYFGPTTPRNVTALMGKSAYLSCRVRNLANKTVSWIRHRDMHILTVGTYTYTSDLRFQAIHHNDTEDWTLQIKWTQKRDAGMFECQISTQPVRSYFVNLNVVVPTATIQGGSDFHVDKGSTINLTCTVKFSLEPPEYIFWYHHEEVINYDSTRGGVSVITEKGDVTTSYLLVQNADLADSGKYSCAPSNADLASVRVHVLSGEHPEAMQTGSSGCQYSWLTIVLLITHVFFYKQQSMTWNPSTRTKASNATTYKTPLAKRNTMPRATPNTFKTICPPNQAERTHESCFSHEDLRNFKNQYGLPGQRTFC
ncbi:hemicentin-1 [Stomoxys calcitrans]|uniref:hemicentin-1 n=1 Tax=Stomoxys calcitrans TaxID=35570 RepID=UPI0027E39E2F|nr:hemicentin-1 [Stomoxys calcitrans]XP_059218927.1 hemicentin-1 [Stomoxys calcitrans]XP_059218933.1 hemicentin-1 [Stomoxys calcitrans]